MLNALKKSHKEHSRRVADSVRKKEYPCFLCNGKCEDKGIPLLVSQTTFSRICLGEKLQEILGEKFIVLITSKDAVCWGCAKYINWVDKCEGKLDVARGNILNMVVTKYKNVEMSIENLDSKRDKQRNGPPVHIQKSTDDLRNYNIRNLNDVVEGSIEKNKHDKKKQYECLVCYKVFASPAALGVHKARQHPTQHVCEYCGLILSTEVKYKAHMAKHVAKTAPVMQKLLSCVLCGFKTRNMETYCRHACDSKIVSLVCSSCRKRYIHNKSTTNIPGKNLCPDCSEVEDVEHDFVSIEPEDLINQLPTTITTMKAVMLEDQLKEKDAESPEHMTLTMTVDEVNDLADDTLVKQEQILKFNGIMPETVNANPIHDSDNLSTVVPGVDERFEDPTSSAVGDEEIQSETISSDLHNEMPEFFRPPQEKRLSDQSVVDDLRELMTEVGSNENDAILSEVNSSLLKCTNCDEEFKISQIATHACFISGDAMEYSEVENESDYISVPVYCDPQTSETLLTPNGAEVLRRGNKSVVNRRRIPKIPAQENAHFSQLAEPETKMHCKTCYAEFRSINLMRQHWDLTGHSREVSTTTIELNKIKDKNNKTEQTFKVVKQNFNIRANVIGQNDEDIKRNDEALNNCIVKVKETPSIEEFMLRKDGKMCGTCGIIFGNSELLAEHQCTDSDSLICVTCHIKFMDSKLLKKHYQYTGHSTKIFNKQAEQHETVQIEHQVVDPYFCPKCNKTFPARLALSKHLKTHYKGTNRGACHYCLLEFDDKSQIQQHVLEVHGAYLYKCEHCDRAFLTKSVRNKHQLKHVIHMCKVCKVKFANQRLLLVHMDKVHRSKACRICGKMITDLYALRRHERRHFYETGLKCDFCDKSFRNKASLRTHNRLHDSEVIYRCKTCNLGFKSPRNLEDHEIVHIRKHYTCTKCSTVCPSRNFFWMHMKLHESAYKCSVCGRLFRDTSLLAIHKRKHFRARPYQCPRCPRVFSVPATLRRHLTVHTRTYPFKCGLCKKGFLTKYAYHKHLDTVHALRNTHPRRILNRIPSLPLNATDEDILQAADTLISDDAIMFNDYQKDVTIEQVPSSDMITEEVVVETTELFDEILH